MPTGSRMPSDTGSKLMPNTCSRSTALSEKNCAYLKKPSEPRLIAIDDARIARRYDGRCTRSIQCEASQSKPVVAMISSTKNGFHAA